MNNSLKEILPRLKAWIHWKEKENNPEDKDFIEDIKVIQSVCQRVFDGDLISREKLEDLRDKLEAENFRTMTELMELKKRVLDAGKEIQAQEYAHCCAGGHNEDNCPKCARAHYYNKGFYDCHDLFTAYLNGEKK